MIDQPLITKYRPASFDEVVGHDAIMAALRRAMAADTCPHSYLLTGPAGTGKTTTARLIMADQECDVIEIDAASTNGVDDMRQLVELGNHMALSGAGRRGFIIDECHALSKAAWQALLKIVEEPPPHLFIALCTTELAKVPETIVTRCYHVALRSIKPDAMSELLDAVCEIEGWEVHSDVMSEILKASTGQPRKALSILQTAHDAPNRDEVARIISIIDASEPIIEICQALLKGVTSWKALQPILARIDDADFENGIAGAARYLLTAMLNGKSDQASANAYNILEALIQPSVTFDRKVQFCVAIGRICFNSGS